jgi:hypothetical protein
VLAGPGETVWAVIPAPLQEHRAQANRMKQPKRRLQILRLTSKAPLTAAAAALAVCLSLLATPASPQGGSESGISVESSQQLFAVMCALDASGFGENSSDLSHFLERAALRRRLEELQGPSTDALRKYYHDHALKDPGEMLSRYISFALIVGPPPRFIYQLDRELLPPDVLTLEGFDVILSNFYREANLDREWQRAAKEYDGEIQRYESPVQQALFIASGYLREVMSPGHGRTFTVFVEPYTGSRTNFRNYGDHYSIVVGSQSQIPIDDIRHAYLHFMVDPLVSRSRMEIDKKRELLEVASKAPLLPLEYRDEFFALFDECAVRAIEMRVKKLSPAEQEAAMDQDDREGLILVRPIVKQLKLYEKAGPAMHYYFPDIVKGIDADSEKVRLKDIKFATAQPVKATPDNTHVAATPEGNLEKDLADGDQQIASQNGPAAQVIFEKVLANHPGLPAAMYGLAMASVLQGRASAAEKLFEQIIANAGAPGAPAVDPATLAWSHVYLGRIHDLRGDRDLALTEYDAALAVAGAPDSARTAAQRGQSSPYNPSGSAPKGTGSDKQ